MASDLQNQPFLVDVTVFGTPNLVTPYANMPGGSPFPYKLDRGNPIFSLPVSTNFMSPDLVIPYVQHYSLMMEQQLFPTLSVQAGYVGNTSRKLFYQRDANTPIYTPGKSTAGNVNQRRPYLPASFAQMAEMLNGAERPLRLAAGDLEQALRARLLGDRELHAGQEHRRNFGRHVQPDGGGDRGFQ